MGKNIRALRTARGWTLQQLELASGVDVGTIHALEARDSSRSQYFPALAKALGVTYEQLQNANEATIAAKIGTADGRVHDIEVPMFMRKEHPAPVYGMSPILSWQHEDELPPGDFVFIPRLNVKLSAGSGREQVEFEFVEKQPQAFRTDWIRKQGLKPSKLASMVASGDSMEERIHDGDSLVVDTSQTDVKDGGVYALWYEGGERVKRLYRLPGGGLRIHSDNETKYPDVNVRPDELEHVRIIGRVVHQSGTGGL